MLEIKFLIWKFQCRDLFLSTCNRSFSAGTIFIYFLFVTEICVINTNFKRLKTAQRAVIYTIL